VPERDESRPWPGVQPHPERAYVKAFLVKICQTFDYVTELRSFLVKHPLLVLEIGFQPVLDNSQPYGFDVEETVPCDRWLRQKQRTLDNKILQALFRETVHQLQVEIPKLGQTVVIDTKHIYAWVKENNPREFITGRFDPNRQPTGDPDCRLGVKRSSNQDEVDDAPAKVVKEYLWGYGTGLLAATYPEYGDVVLAEYTLPFNEADSTYFAPLYERLVETTGFLPENFAGDAAFDAWHIYQPFAEVGGMAAIPLNLRGHAQPKLGPGGYHLCPRDLEMAPSYQFNHGEGYRAQLLRCPKLFPLQPTATCDHPQFGKGGCIKQINIEAGGWMRVQLDRQSEAYKQLYKKRTASERINSQAKALGIERPKVRNGDSVVNLNTLTYIVINARALQRVRNIKAQARPP
jgi:hypothetical protein